MMTKLMLSISLILGALAQNAVAGGKGFSGYPVKVTINNTFVDPVQGLVDSKITHDIDAPYINGVEGRLCKLDEVFSSNQKFSFRISQDGTTTRYINNLLNQPVAPNVTIHLPTLGSDRSYNDFEMPTPLSAFFPSFLSMHDGDVTSTSAEIRAYDANLGTGIILAFGGGFTVNAPGTTNVSVTRNSSTKWTIDIPANSIGRLFIHGGKGPDRDQGLYYYSGQLVIELLP